jgi:hypothetical protein
MKAVTKVLAGGIVAAGLVAAAPAAAQYYPGYGYPGYGYGPGQVIGQVLNQVLGGGFGGYGYNSQAAVQQCSAAVQARLSRDYAYGGGYSPYGYATPYGGYGYSQARVLGVSRIEPRSGGGLTVRGVATTGMNAGYGGYGYNGHNGSPDLTWRCRLDSRGFVRDIDIDRAQTNYGYNQPYAQPYSPYTNAYSQYGYRRY